MSTIIRNLARNPSFESGTDWWSPVYGTLARLPASSFNGVMAGDVGGYFAQVTSDGTSQFLYLRTSLAAADRIPVAAGQWVGARMWVATDNNHQVRINVPFFTSAGTGSGSLFSPYTPSSFYSGSTIQVVGQAPATSASFRIEVISWTMVSGQVQPVGARLWGDALMVVVGDSQAEVEKALSGGYMDADTPGWVSEGAWQNSASRGPLEPYVMDGYLWLGATGTTGVDYLDAVADFTEDAESASTVQTTMNTSGTRHHVTVRPASAETGTLTLHFTRELGSGAPGERARAVAASLKTGAPHVLDYRNEVGGLEDFAFVPTGAVTRRLEIETVHRKRQAVWTVTVDYTRVGIA